MKNYAVSLCISLVCCSTNCITAFLFKIKNSSSVICKKNLFYCSFYGPRSKHFTMDKSKQECLLSTALMLGFHRLHGIRIQLHHGQLHNDLGWWLLRRKKYDCQWVDLKLQVLIQPLVRQDFEMNMHHEYRVHCAIWMSKTIRFISMAIHIKICILTVMLRTLEVFVI